MRELIRALYLLFILVYFVATLYTFWKGVRSLRRVR